VAVLCVLRTKLRKSTRVVRTSSRSFPACDSLTARHTTKRVSRRPKAPRAGADVLVIGRAVTHASDPRAAARRVYEAVSNA
jgi:orotidine-5'-phosphate decarboxylase